jgi:putative transposase
MPKSFEVEIGKVSYHAVTETLFGSLKVERLHDMRFEIRRQAQDEIIDLLAFYNRKRMHSIQSYTNPIAFEEN